MPTHAAKARILLRQGKATVVKRVPFCIQLRYPVSNRIQSVTVGIDDGGIMVGIAAVSCGKAIYQEEVKLRTDIKKLLDTRRSYRRDRRNRKTRYRQPRFLNRRASISTCKVCGGNAPASQVMCRRCLGLVGGVHQRHEGIKKTVFRLPPSIRAKKEAIARTVTKLPFPIAKIRLEDTYFDTQAMENPDITREGYQSGPLLYEKNFKNACKTRDGYKCRVCKVETNLQVHHIKLKSKGGTDKLSNLMTLCSDCHEKHHKEGLRLPKQMSTLYVSAAHVQQGKHYLQSKLCSIAPLSTTFGYITAYRRNQAGLPKSHVNDALMIADESARPLSEFLKTVCVRPRKRSTHEATARKGCKEPNRTQKRNAKNTRSLKGIKRWDTVEFGNKVGFVASFGGSGCYLVDIEGNYIQVPWSKNGKGAISTKYLWFVHGNQDRISMIQKTQEVLDEETERHQERT